MRLFWQIINSFSAEKRLFSNRLKQLLGYTPVHLEIFEQALNHSSQSGEATQNNERLEYLGDAILDAVVGAFLFRKYPKQEEGFLTELRSKIVSRKKLGEVGNKMKLAEYLNYDSERVKMSNKLLGNALEAVIGAVYLDAGYRQAEKFINQKIMIPHINLKTIFDTDANYKSILLEWAQKYRKPVTFDLAETITNDKDISFFVMEARVDGKVVGKAKARSKKIASKEAARYAIRKLDIDTQKSS